MTSGPNISRKQMGEKWKQWQIFLSWAPKLLQTVTVPMKLKDTCSLEEKLRQIQHIEKQTSLSDKVMSVYIYIYIYIYTILYIVYYIYYNTIYTILYIL